MMLSCVTGERVTNLRELKSGTPATVTTDKGSSIAADCVFTATGLHIQKDAYATSELSESGMGGAMEGLTQLGLVI